MPSPRRRSARAVIDAGYNYPGHTELLAEISRTSECRMMLIGHKLRVVPVTGHVALMKVSRGLTRNSIRTTMELTHRSLREFFAIARPRIAVAALNPHAGEEGIFGQEEKEIIAPRCGRRRWASGPRTLPADGCLSLRGDYDAVVCMYRARA
jgi:4-hydroxythreonine-4-phosphate dehydrogenase